MSMHFSANQYEGAFNSKKLKNWTVPRKYKERPKSLEGFSQIVATDRGHLKPNVPRSQESPWGTFMGTWDMPCEIPPVKPTYTARSRRAANNLKTFKDTSVLNKAVNGYQSFPVPKVRQTSTVPRPKTPSPPSSTRVCENIMEPSAGVVITPSPRKSASPRGYKQVSPRAASRESVAIYSKPASPADSLGLDNLGSPSGAKALSPVPSGGLPATPDSGRPKTKGSMGKSPPASPIEILRG